MITYLRRRYPLRSFFNEISERITYQKPCKINSFKQFPNILNGYPLRIFFKKIRGEIPVRSKRQIFLRIF